MRVDRNNLLRYTSNHMATTTSVTSAARNRYLPFRILAILQYGNFPRFMFVQPGGHITLSPAGELCQLLGLRTDKVYGAIQWLGDKGYIQGLTRSGRNGSRIDFILVPPRNILPEDGNATEG